MKYLKTTFLLLVAFAFTMNAQMTFTASKNARNQATFVSDAPLENITGVTNNLEAMAMIDVNNISNMPRGMVKVDLRELNTGIDLRNEHLRGDMWLNTAKFPYAIFKLMKITDAASNKLKNGKKVSATLHGTITIHGVTKNISAPAFLTYYKESPKTASVLKGNLLKVNADFSVKLSDFGIMIPDMVVGKVDDNIKVSTNFVATDAGGSKMMMGACNPCGATKGKGNPCNPSGKMMKKGNPCNPCGVK